MKRDVQEMRDEMKSGIIKINFTFKPFEQHVYTVLKNSTLGPTTSLFLGCIVTQLKNNSKKIQ